MSPFVSVPIFVFYMTIVLCLFLSYLSKTKGVFLKDEKQKPCVCGAGLFFSFLIGSCLFANITAVKIFTAALPLFAAGFLEDIKFKLNSIVRYSLPVFSFMLLAFFVGFDFKHFSFVEFHAIFIVLVSLLFAVTTALGFKFIRTRAVLSSFFLAVFSLFAFLFYRYGCIELFESALITASSVLGYFTLDVPFHKTSFGRSGLYLAGFFFAVMCVELLKKVNF